MAPVKTLGLALLPDRGSRAGAIAGPNDGCEGLRLVGGISPHGRDEVRDKIVAAPELHVDLRPGVVHPVAQLHQAVVHQRARYHYQHTRAPNTHHDNTCAPCP